MALIKLNVGTQISGKIGGLIFASNKGGQYVKAYRKPVQPNTAKQLAVRLALSALSAFWRTLSFSVRTAWNNMSINYPYVNSIGETKYYTGQQLYCKLNGNLILCGLPKLTDPLVPAQILQIPPTTIITADATLGSMVMSGQGVIPATTDIVVYATNQMSAGINNYKNRLRKIAVLNTLDADPYDLMAEYSAVFGPIAVGDKIGFSLVQISNLTGQALPGMLLDSIAV